MDLLYSIFLVLHFLGWGIVLGGTIVNLRTPRIAPGVLHGALTALITGILLVGLAEGVLDKDIDTTKIAVKLIIAVVVTALVIVANRKEKPSRGMVGGIAALTAVNIVVAAIW